MIKDRLYYKNKILERLNHSKDDIIEQFGQNEIKSFVLDDLLPEEDAHEIYNVFPQDKDMHLKKTIREYKYIDAQLDKHTKLLEEITFAFHHQDILDFFSNNFGMHELIADTSLYAGGLSRMEKDHYLNPHLDNSHNKDRSLYRAVNLLFYVTPDRKLEDGGNLELWDNGVSGGGSRVIHSKFNRLAVMVTDKNSWHSVSKVISGNRCCVSNYYFSKEPLNQDYFHVTSFKGFPDQTLRNIVLTTDNTLRMLIRKIFKKGAYKVTHQYKR